MANNDQLPDFLDTQAVIQHDQQQLALYPSLDAAGS
jgi:hypothetical protein